MKAGRELDAAVHLALWPRDEVFWFDGAPGLERKRGWRVRHEGQCYGLPNYSTDLGAWDFEREGWRWYSDEQYDSVYVRLYIGKPLDVVEAYSGTVFCDEEPNRFRAQALARSRCVLQWAERRKRDAE